MSGEEPGAYVRVATVGDLPVGEGMAITIGEREVALFHVEGGWFAIDNVCPHQGGPLSEGWVEGETVTCPWHAWCFEVKTGAMTLGDFATVDAFDVRIQGEEVLVAPRPRAACVREQ
ncbi:MAG: nitrite reductase small subunit NirD [bacterium]|nr:nitrite reductase small subunit NirD [bacterium]